MDKIGLLFPGQGSQHVGMGKDLYDELPAARRIMDAANDILGFDLKNIVFNGTDEELLPTQIAQPAVFVVSAMYFEKFKQMDKSFEIVAGHSLGEYSGLYAAGVLSFEDCLKLVRKRGLAMSEHNGLGVMFAIMGIDLEHVNELLSEYQHKVVVANINSKNQIVISGYVRETTEVVERLMQTKGATAKKLNVSGAFHSPLMFKAKTVMAEELKKVQLSEPTVYIVPNVLGYATKDVEEIRHALIDQITGQVKWVDTILFMKNNGINQLYEVGPGRVLTKLNQTITFRPKCHTLEDE